MALRDFLQKIIDYYYGACHPEGTFQTNHTFLTKVSLILKSVILSIATIIAIIVAAVVAIKIAQVSTLL